MPQVVAEKKPKLPLKYVIFGVIGLVLAVVMGIAAWFLLPQKQSVAELVAESTDLSEQGKTQDALNKLNGRYAHTYKREDKALLEMGLQIVYENSKNYPKAIEAAENAIRYGAAEGDMDAALARAYEATGDKAKAREYYQKAVDYYNSKYANEPNHQSNYAKYYQERLREVGE